MVERRLPPLAAKLGAEGEPARELAYRLYALSERRKRTAEALSASNESGVQRRLAALGEPSHSSRGQTERRHGMKLYTIGFTKKTAEAFFEALRGSGVKRVVDVRLNNVSQLAGFAKKGDLAYFLREICGIDYVHLPILAPSKEMLDAFKRRGGEWTDYERRFLDLMARRRIEEQVPKDAFANGCLLCSEDKPHHCHRRLVAEYLKGHWGDVEIKHLAAARGA